MTDITIRSYNKYLIVLFTEENEVGIIPRLWAQSTTVCLYPNFKNKSVSDAVKREVHPAADWRQICIRIFESTG